MRRKSDRVSRNGAHRGISRCYWARGMDKSPEQSRD